MKEEKKREYVYLIGSKISAAVLPKLTCVHVNWNYIE